MNELFPTELPEGVKYDFFPEANLAIFRKENRVRSLVIKVDGIEIRENFRLVHGEKMMIDQLDELVTMLETNIEAVYNIVFSFH